MSRTPVPVSAIDNKNSRYTKEQLELRAEGEPTGASADLRCPKYLSPDAKKEWKRIIGLHNQLQHGIWNDLDKQTLIEYCETVAIYNRAQQEWVEVQRVTTVNSKGDRCIDPFVKIMLDISKTMNLLKEQLCMSALGRARMGVAKAKGRSGKPDELLD